MEPLEEWERSLRQAAEDGDEVAALRLAVLLEERGDAAEAERWLQRAMEGMARRMATRQRRQVAAAVDLALVFGLSFAFLYAFHPPNWGYFVALAAIWFLVEVPPIAITGRGLGHRVAGTRIAELSPSSWTADRPSSGWQTPSWWKSFVRWLFLVPGYLGSRLRITDPCPHDGWSGTLVLVERRASRTSGEPDDQTVGEWKKRAAELEQLARQRPRRYRFQVALVAAAGYAFVIGLATVILAASGTIAYAIANGVGTPIGVLTFVLPLLVLSLKTFSSLHMPSSLSLRGTVIRTGAAPRLTDLVEELRVSLGARHVHELVIDGDANAGVLQQPRFGPFGPYRNVLVLGLPLLQALSVSELRAVLAHELAHLSRKHGRLGAWIYRLRQAYSALLHQLEQQSWTAITARFFFEHYAPYFNLYTLALARAHEYEADRVAATITTPATLGLALQRSALLQRFLEQSPSPAEAAYASEHGQSATERDLEEILASHPSTPSRLAALGVPQQPLPPVTTSAAKALLPEAFQP